MKTRDILHLLKVLLLLSEQVGTLIAATSIPQDQRKNVHKEVESTVSTLQVAKQNIDVEPSEI